MKWKKNARNSYEAVSDNNQYDYNIRLERGFWVLDVFNHKIKNPDTAHLFSDGYDTIEEAKENAEKWI